MLVRELTLYKERQSAQAAFLQGEILHTFH